MCLRGEAVSQMEGRRGRRGRRGGSARQCLVDDGLTGGRKREKGCVYPSPRKEQAYIVVRCRAWFEI